MLSDILKVMANTAIIYTIVLLGLRVLGKKDLGQLSVTDILFIMLVSEAVGDVMRASHNSLLSAIVAAGTLVSLNKVLNIALYKSRKLRRLINGVPSVVVRSGKPNYKEMKRNRLTIEDLEQSARESGKSDIADIRLAILEVDGKISVLEDDNAKASGPINE